MPRVTSPLFSVSAQGSIGKCITYRNSPRGAICRKWAQPTGLPSANQIAVRDFTGERMNHWPLISTEDQASWFLLALERNIEPINAYLQVNWERHLQAKSLTDFYPPVDVPPVYSLTVTGYAPDPFPDFSGEYYEAGVFNDQPYYTRSELPEAFIFFYEEIWYMSYLLENGQNEYCWVGPATINGDYVGQTPYTGSHIVSSPHYL